MNYQVSYIHNNFQISVLGCQLFYKFIFFYNYSQMSIILQNHLYITQIFFKLFLGVNYITLQNQNKQKINQITTKYCSWASLSLGKLKDNKRRRDLFMFIIMIMFLFRESSHPTTIDFNSWGIQWSWQESRAIPLQMQPVFEANIT